MSFTTISSGDLRSAFPDVYNENLRRAYAGFLPPTAKTASFTVWAGDTAGAPEVLYLCTNTITATLPAATSTDAALGRLARIKNNGAGTVTVSPDGSDTVDGAASLALAAGDSVTLVSDGTSDWVVI